MAQIDKQTHLRIEDVRPGDSLIFPSSYQFRRATRIMLQALKRSSKEREALSIGYVISSIKEIVSAPLDSREHCDDYQVSYHHHRVQILLDGKVQMLPISHGLIPMCEILFNHKNLKNV